MKLSNKTYPRIVVVVIDNIDNNRASGTEARISTILSLHSQFYRFSSFTVYLGTRADYSSLGIYRETEIEKKVRGEQTCFSIS